MEVFLILAPIFFTIHNIEEALWLTKWSQLHSPLKNKQTQKQFIFSVSIITLIGWGFYILSVFFPSKNTTYLFYAFLAVMIINSIFPHLALSIRTKTYMPGLGTAILLLIPTYSFMILNAIKNDTIIVPSLLIYLVIVGISLLLLLFILDHLSRIFFNN